MSRTYGNLTLSRLHKKGWLHRVRRGLYTIVPLHSNTGSPLPEDPLAIARGLFAPCYMSGWIAAEHWDLTEQVSNAVALLSYAKRLGRGALFKRLGFTVERFGSVSATWPLMMRCFENSYVSRQASSSSPGSRGPSSEPSNKANLYLS